MAETTEDARQRLAAAAAGQEMAGLYRGRQPNLGRPKVAFLFPGDGSAYLGMGRRLFDSEPVFQQALLRCMKLLWPSLPQPLAERPFDDAGLLGRSEHARAALFAIEYALAETWQSWGIVPDVVFGEGVGEVVAACVAGVCSLEEAVARITQSNPATTFPSAAHERRSVFIATSMETLVEQGCGVLLEVGPGLALSDRVRAFLPDAMPILPSLRQDAADGEVMLASLAQMYVSGVAVDWVGFDRDRGGRKLALPTYPFERQRYWAAGFPRPGQKPVTRCWDR